MNNGFKWLFVYPILWSLALSFLGTVPYVGILSLYLGSSTLFLLPESWADVLGTNEHVTTGFMWIGINNLEGWAVVFLLMFPVAFLPCAAIFLMRFFKNHQRKNISS